MKTVGSIFSGLKVVMHKLQSLNSSIVNRQSSILKLAVIAVILLLGCTQVWAIEARREVRPNGLVLLHAEKNNLPIVKVTLLIKASPSDEPPEKAGLANLVAELLPEGTKTRTSEQISEEIEFIGGDLGASVDRDYTAITLSVLKKDIEEGFKLLSDILLNPVFPEDEIRREKDLIKGSLKQSEEDPEFVAEREFRKAVYGPHPYGRLIEGSPDTIDAISREDLLWFYRAFYRPNNAILSIVGDISYKEVAGLLRGYLSGWQAGGIPRVDIPPIPELKEKVVVTVDRSLTQANILLGHLGIKRSNPDYYAVSVMNYILGGGGFASRLMNRIRDDMGLAYDVYSTFDTDKDRGVFEVGVQTKNEAAKTVIDVVIEEIKRIQKEPVSDEELRDAKAYLTGSFPRRLDTMGKIASFLTLTEFYQLGIDYDKLYPGYIKLVTKEDVQRVAAKYLDPEKYVLVVVADLKKAGFQQ
ncbi:hypothetical protein MNBD_NITROSPIRAE02-156 [hydrothermal vent metagenome]|uniref:Insulinase family protein n=1 Tax=hydrothermal vent metagenome TaxID=652676 RepID=A0A3B1CT04_9ZZZZ